MIKGNRNVSLQYSTKTGGKLDRLSIQVYEPSQESILRTFGRQEGKLTITSTGYKYEPSKKYLQALKNFHKPLKKRVQTN